MLSADKITDSLKKGGFWEKKTWKIAPTAWRFSESEISELHTLGFALYAFYRALEKLYLASAGNRTLLRNGNLRAPWVAELLDRGKPPRLIEHQRSRALIGTLPPVIRPDLLICEDGFALTELDSVPGGIGLTALLSRLYSTRGNEQIPELFLNSISFGKSDANIAIAVSDEADDYRAEFEWLAGILRTQGAKITVCHPNSLTVSDNGVFLNETKIDIIYRFFELFDLDNVHDADALFSASEQGNVLITPPMRPFQEEKLSLALLHHPALFPFWQETLGEKKIDLMKRIVPETWIVEPIPDTGLPACATLHAPTINGRAARDWNEFYTAAKRDRELVLKASGFDETAWGSRSVTIGTDTSQSEWQQAWEQAFARMRERNSVYVLQRFRKPIKTEHQIFGEDGKITPAFGRVRICPYYFVKSEECRREHVQLGGALCTFCPPDKKIIHGMSVAALIPCAWN